MKIETPGDYQDAAARTMNSDLTREQRLCMLTMGLSGEAGEVVDQIKKHVFHGHELDNDKVKKELGDVLWYVANTCTEIGTTLKDVMQGNVDKLKKRYPDGFSSERSIHREEGFGDGA